LRLLLDTHVAFWAIAKRDRLPDRICDLIADPDNTVTVSSVSVWEIAIKHALSKNGVGEMPISGAQALDHFRQAGFEFLSVSVEHGAAVEELPRLHRDPFDRLLVAQALTEPLRLVTHDAQVAAYSDSVIHF
jgi:PIN domain nuclease of toxin-antitoxin system